MSGRTSRRVAGGALAIVLVCAVPVWSQAHPSCRPGPEADRGLAEVHWQSVGCVPMESCWQERIDALDRLRRRFPGEVHVHRAYQNAARAGDGEGLIEKYRALRDDHPQDPMFLYLLARLLRGDELAGAVERALNADAEYPWARLARIGDYLGRTPPLREAAFENLQAFMRLCPEATAPVLAYAGRLGEPAFWRQRLPGLRRLIAEEAIHEQLQSYPRLWTLEFQLLPPSEHEAARDRVRQDLARLQGLEAPKEAPLLDLLARGWELVGEERRLAEVHARQDVVDACSRDVMSRTVDVWAETQGATAGAVRSPTPELAREMYAVSSQWLENCPDSFPYWSFHMRAAAVVDEIDESTLLADIDRYLAMWANWENRIGTWRSPYRVVAEILLERGISLERVPDLVMREREYVEGRESGQSSVPEALRAQIEESNRLREIEIDLLAARAEIALGRLVAAAEALDALEVKITELAEMPELGRMSASGKRAAMLSLRAELALAQGRRPDAIVYWRRAAVEGSGSPAEATGYQARAREVWLELGGSEETFALLSADRSEPRTAERMSAWREVDRALTPFELVDLEGRTWSDQDLLGQTVLINVWATWCGPCLAEMPYVEQLQESLEGRKDLRVVTFNVDRNPGLVVPYLEKQAIELDVLLATRYIEQEMGGWAIPLNWIVDPGGRIRREQSGFSAEGAELWVGEARRAMEAVAGGDQ